MAHILLIDDDDRLASHLRKWLEEGGHQVRWLEVAEPALDLLRDGAFDLVLVDYSLPGGMDGIEFLAALREQRISIPVIVMTGCGTPDTAIRARQLGAHNYVVKEDPRQLAGKLEPVVEEMLRIGRLNRERVHLPPPDTAVPGGHPGPTLLGNSGRMQQVYARIAHIAASDLPVLVRGETGTGKELVARAIFQYSGRSGKPFVPVNCPGLPEHLLESELFGHEKGAFTGAVTRRIGKFEQADGGTLLLDEIGDMSPSTQAKILRALQEGEVERLGGSEVLKVDVRVIACTNRNLESAMSAGTFREDLYFRLRGMRIDLPPLRERGPDLELLANHFLTRETQGKGRPRLTFHESALNKLRAHPWPGNVRELENVIRLAALVCRGPQVMPADLELDPPACPSCPKQDPGPEDALAGLRTAIRWAWDTGGNEVWRLLEDHLRRELARFALGKLGGNKTQAVERLGISRTTLNEWLGEGKPRPGPGGGT
jgi:DNA-binding NtrC family response regulator